MKRPPGRMMRISLSYSKDFSSLSDQAKLLFLMILPHLNSHGKMQANPYTIKGIVVPLLDSFNLDNIPPLLAEISNKTTLKYWEENHIGYLQSLTMQNHQDLRADRLGEDHLPDYPQSNNCTGVRADHSGNTPGGGQHEVEVKEEVEVDLEVKIKDQEEGEAEVLEANKRLHQKRRERGRINKVC